MAFFKYLLLIRRKIIDLADVDNYCRKTLDPNFKGVVFQYITNALYSNQQNFKRFTYKICPEPLMTNHLIIYFRKNFYLVDEISERILRLRSTGIFNFFISKYAEAKFMKVDSDNTGPSQLTVYHFIGIIQLWIFGLGVSSVLFLVEVCVHWIRRRKK
jgi:hypothetical protein